MKCRFEYTVTFIALRLCIKYKITKSKKFQSYKYALELTSKNISEEKNAL